MVFTFVVLISLLVVWGGSRIADSRFQSAEKLEKKVVKCYIETGEVSTHYSRGHGLCRCRNRDATPLKTKKHVAESRFLPPYLPLGRRHFTNVFIKDKPGPGSRR